jgi:hypothetical protein
MTISLTLLLLCVLPILLVLLFRGTLAARKEKTLIDEIKKLNATASPIVNSKGGVEGIQQNVQDTFSHWFLLPPAILLSLLYLPGFLLCNAFLNLRMGDKSTWPFFPDMISCVRPVVFAFVGVYLFNLGAMIRRLYLSDLTEHVFWGALNRLLLTIGTAVVVATGFKLGASDANSQAGFIASTVGSDAAFFAIGFLANAFLQFVLQAGLRIGKVNRSNTEDMPPQLVRGINIWKEYRLEEEGIEDVQNLATADVIELAIKTHYPIRTLIDWIDQAVIISRLGKDKADLLWKSAIPLSAIDLASQSPQNAGTDVNAQAIAKILGLEPLFVANLMNSLFEDAFVQTLWTLWQTRREVKDYPTSSVVPSSVVPSSMVPSTIVPPGPQPVPAAGD